MKHIILVAPSRSGHNWTAKMLRSWLPGDKVHKFEGIPPKIYHNRIRTEVWRGAPPKKDQPVIAVLQLRDFLNYAASLIRHIINNATQDRAAGLFDTWYAITREAFNDTHYIGEKYRLYYDHFVRSHAYRQGICCILDGEYNEEAIDFVPNGGRGSSFDDFTYQGRGREMKVLERWKWFLTDEGEQYISYLKARKNIVEYYMEHFDPDPGQRELAGYILK